VNHSIGRWARKHRGRGIIESKHEFAGCLAGKAGDRRNHRLRRAGELHLQITQTVVRSCHEIEIHVGCCVREWNSNDGAGATDRREDLRRISRELHVAVRLGRLGDKGLTRYADFQPPREQTAEIDGGYVYDVQLPRTRGRFAIEYGQRVHRLYGKRIAGDTTSVRTEGRLVIQPGVDTGRLAQGNAIAVLGDDSIGCGRADEVYGQVGNERVGECEEDDVDVGDLSLQRHAEVGRDRAEVGNGFRHVMRQESSADRCCPGMCLRTRNDQSEGTSNDGADGPRQPGAPQAGTTRSRAASVLY
jgi:hypothetical protein